jgi:hypothetical protein
MFADLCHFYQMGFVARDLDRATEAMGRRFGVTRFRRKRSSDWMETAHAWTADAMIELMVLGEGAPALYSGYLPDAMSAVRLHHHGYRVADEAGWAAIERRVADAGLDAPMKGAVMNGDLHFMYVDTRAELGIYSEFVMLRGSASGLYDDVPRN